MPHGQLYLFSFTPLRRQRHACPLTETWAFWLRAIKRTTDTRIAIRTNGEYYILLRHSIPVSEAIVKYVITKEVTIHNLTSKGKAPLLIQVGHNAGNKRKRPGAQSSRAVARMRVRIQMTALQKSTKIQAAATATALQATAARRRAPV